MAEWLEAGASRVLPIPLGSVKLFIELPVDCESDPRLMRAEKWLRNQIDIAHRWRPALVVPGGRIRKATSLKASSFQLRVVVSTESW
jgi:hypothetical protein